MYFGLSAGEWQVIGVVGGLLVGFIGLLVNIWFKQQHLKIARRKAFPDPEE